MIIIVARYNEDINWTKQLPNVLICNKGDKLNIDNELLMDNVGREGHTYYKYIYDNYDNLDDYIIFLQGNPFDHSPNIIEDLQTYIHNKDLNINFEYLSKWIVPCNLNGCKFHKDLPLKQVYKFLFGHIPDNLDFTFGAGAQFIVSKKQIQKRPKIFYLKLVKLLDRTINPIAGYVIERFHNLIFSD